MNKVVKIILVVIWMTVIFCFSNQKAEDSSKLSDGVIIKVAKIFVKDNISKEKKQELIQKYTFIIRKMAHFTVYLILGILVIDMVSSFNLKNVIIMSVSICFLYALSDEFHQLFVDGRSCELRDVLIDTIGSYVGILIYNGFKKRLMKK